MSAEQNSAWARKLFDWLKRRLRALKAKAREVIADTVPDGLQAQFRTRTA